MTTGTTSAAAAWRGALGLLLTMLLAVRVSAHVGSPDVFFEGHAGPYRLLVAISAPAVVPGVAQIDVRVLEGTPREVRVVPLRLTGPGAVFAPVSDRAVRSDDDPRSFKAGLWMMEAGAWQVRISIDGESGSGQVSVPVDALASRTLKMDRGIALVLLPLGLFLVLGFVAIVGASVGQAQVEPGRPLPPARQRRARIARVLAFAFIVTAVALGNWWWNVEARAYDDNIYKPLQLEPHLDAAGGSLELALRDPGWLKFRVLDDLVPDHGHTMHLFAVRTPGLDRLLHLHPQQQESGSFAQPLPAIAAGRYRLFADIVHGNGLPETAVSDVTLPAIAAGAPAGDDSEASAPADGAFDLDRMTAALPDGGRMTWERERGSLKAKHPYLLKFRVDDKDGSPARDLTPYMGMPGHAIVLRRDLSVFAHVHPFGTAPMASLALTAATLDPHAQHMQQAGSATALPPSVSFPYGFPREGDYRLFIQVRRSSGVQTGVFDIHVD